MEKNMSCVVCGRDSEEWRDVSGYEGKYQVSDHGQIIRKERAAKDPYKSGHLIKTRIMTICKYKKLNYLYVGLNSNRVQKKVKVHRLVALAFIPNPENKPQVNHIDGNKSNNCVTNLEWATSKENVVHAFNTGLRLRGEGAGSSRLKAQEVIDMRQLYSTGNYSYPVLAKIYGVGINTVYQAIKRLTWKHI